MPIPSLLRNKLVAASGGGAMLIAMLFIGGHDGVEGRAYKPYKDVAGVWTVCDGITGHDVIKTKIYSDQECDFLLAKYLELIKEKIDPLIHVPLSEYQRAALYSFTWNVGIYAFSHSSLLRKLNARNYVGACDEMRRWVYAGGMKWKGLQNRRDMERALCLAENANDLVN